MTTLFFFLYMQHIFIMRLERVLLYLTFFKSCDDEGVLGEYEIFLIARGQMSDALLSCAASLKWPTGTLILVRLNQSLH